MNSRHDIVLDQGPEVGNDTAVETDSAVVDGAEANDAHVSGFEEKDADGRGPLKVSGSAYKLTRARSLHHATALLDSPNLHVISRYLGSPARAFVTARGVESVSSPVGNIGVVVGDFMDAVKTEFGQTYSSEYGFVGNIHHGDVGDEIMEIDAVRKGVQELRSDEWFWGQTPQFSIDLGPFSILVKHGEVIEASFKAEGNAVRGLEVKGSQVHQIQDWSSFVGKSLSDTEKSDMQTYLDQLNDLLRVPQRP